MGGLEEREFRSVPLVIRVRAVPPGVAIGESTPQKNSVMEAPALLGFLPLRLVTPVVRPIGAGIENWTGEKTATGGLGVPAFLLRQRAIPRAMPIIVEMA